MNRTRSDWVASLPEGERTILLRALGKRTIRTYAHTDTCDAHTYLDNDRCTCGGFAHRAFGHIGSFTIHAPADYRPRHMSGLSTAHATGTRR